MKEVLTLERTNSLIRIPKKWIDENIPGTGKVQVLRDIDTDRIIITPIKPEGTDNEYITHTTAENEHLNRSTDAIGKSYENPFRN